MELTDEHLLGTLAGIRSSRTINRLTKSHCYNKDALDCIVGTPTNPRPDGAARDPQVKRQYITQRWVDENGVTPGCEKCRKRFESIEKEKLDRQLEEATRSAEPPPVIAAEINVEQPREQPSTGGASSSSVPAQSGQEAVLFQVPVLTKYGWRLLNRPAARDRREVVMRVRASESGALLECSYSTKMTRDYMQQPDTDMFCTVTELAS